MLGLWATLIAPPSVDYWPHCILQDTIKQFLSLCYLIHCFVGCFQWKLQITQKQTNKQTRQKYACLLDKSRQIVQKLSKGSHQKYPSKHILCNRLEHLLRWHIFINIRDTAELMIKANHRLNVNGGILGNWYPVHQQSSVPSLEENTKSLQYDFDK